MTSAIFLLACIGHTLIAANASPLSSGGKKITFSSAMSLDYESIRYNENEPEMGTSEYYDSYRWAAVSSDGMEYEGTLEEVMNYMDPVPEEEDTDDEEQDPPAQPANPHEVNYEMEDDPANPKKDEGFQALSEAMDRLVLTAEKRSIIGRDSRKRVNNVNRFPYTAMGRIDIGCTGTFIARRTVLTTGHCVHEGGTFGKWYRNLNIYRRKGCDPSRGIQHTWKWAVTLNGWRKYGFKTHDIAIITVNTFSPAYMRFEFNTSLSDRKVHMAGYPAENDKNGCLYRTSCHLRTVTSTRLYYPCDTSPGMSGSAVYHYYRGVNGRVIRGVHGYGGISSNSGTRITKYYESKITEWISIYGGN